MAVVVVKRSNATRRIEGLNPSVVAITSQRKDGGGGGGLIQRRDEKERERDDRRDNRIGQDTLVTESLVGGTFGVRLNPR